MMHWSKWLLSLVAAGSLAGQGCKPAAPAPKDRVPPNPNAPALYGPPSGAVSKEFPRALQHPADTNWMSAPFWVLHTELSPGVLVHSSTRYLGLFTDLAEQGLGAPAHVAWSTRDGPRSFKAGETHDVSALEENWLLVWFAGAKGWTNWDSPWAVFLQRKPKWLRLDERGLHLEFPASAGDVVVMPLYGYFKLPPQGRDYLSEHGLKSRKLQSWEWEKALARDPLTRLRYWAGALREFPIYCEESFSVDRARDELTIRSRIHWHRIDDEWGTKHVKLAPVSPALALAAKDKDFPARWSKRFFDMDLPTLFGPYAGVEEVDTFDVTFPWLHYVNETEAVQAPDTNAHPVVAEAMGKLHETVHGYLSTRNPLLRIQRGTFGWESGAKWTQAMLARAAPYLAQDENQKLRVAMREYFLQSLSKPFEIPFGPEWPNPPGALPGWQAYADLTGDWESAQKAWPSLRARLPFAPPRLWTLFGTAPVAGAEFMAQSEIATARLAYKMGDMDEYNYACLRAVQTLAHTWGIQRGAEYFRKQQPWHSMEWMGEQVWIADASGHGWLLDGPDFPKEAEWRNYSGRWQWVAGADASRFVSDWLRDEVRRELNWRQALAKGSNDQLRALLPARSFLLNEPAARLASLFSSEQTNASVGQELLACLAVLRASRTPRYERLIPPGEPSDFVPGAERMKRMTNSAVSLLTTVAAEDRAWPRLVWPSWSAPGGGHWTFGRITPVRDGAPMSEKRIVLNWNTDVITYTLP